MFGSRYWSARYWASRLWQPDAPVPPPPPSGDGLTPETAVAITSLPYTDCADPGAGFASRWYKYIPTADAVTSAYPCPTDPATGANVNIWTGTDPGALDYQGFNTMAPYVWPVKLGGDDLYFEVYVDDIAGGEICLSVVTPTNTPIQAGDLVISEDEDNSFPNLYDPSFEGFWPYTWYGADGTLRSVAATFPGVELGACLNSGIWAVINWDTNQIFIYNAAPGITLRARIDLPVPDGINWTCLGTDFLDFYALYAPNGTDPLTVYKITADGVITGPIATCQFFTTGVVNGGGGQATCGVARDASILYYPSSVQGQGIHRHNLLTDTPLTDIPAADPLDYIGDILVLSDDTLVGLVQNNGGVITSTAKVVHWAADGTVLHSWTVDTYPWEPHHICHAGDNSADHVWVWTQDLESGGPPPANLSGYNRFRLLRLVDGTYEEDFTKGIFNRGKGPYDDTDACGSEGFGAPKSCPLFAMMNAATPPEPPPTPGPVPENCPGGGMLLPAAGTGGGCPESMTLPAGTGGTGCTTC